jgi:hypothetical protein
MKLRTIFVCLALGAVGCGDFFDSVFGDGSNDNPSDDGSSGGIFGGKDGGDGDKPCVNLCKQQVSCPGGGTTSLSGTVKDPAGKTPLYNILVFVPNAPVKALETGATCDRCGSVSGDPLVSTITDEAGHFELRNVPVGNDIPLVVQVGKWRRQLRIPTVPQCVDTKLADDQIRLPKNKGEGDIPQIALTTGGADVMECLLRKVGLDDAEFTTDAGNGRVHFYAGGGGGITAFDATHNAGATFSQAPAFWGTTASLMKYDIVILSCEGQTGSASKPPAAIQALHDYAGLGGRVFASHWHRFWFNTAARTQGGASEAAGPQPSAFEPFATWNDRDAPGDQATDPGATGIIDDSFPKGAAMKKWLVNVNASTTPGQIPIKESKHNVDSIDKTKATQWITMTNPFSTPANMTAVEYLSFNTPIPAPDDQKCGRVVYSDLHVSAGDQHKPWPSGCVSTDLSPQEKALEFMLFDLSSCIQNDNLPPAPPPTVK